MQGKNPNPTMHRDRNDTIIGEPMDTPLKLLERRIRCTTCKARLIHVMPETYSIEHDMLGKPRE